MSPPDTLYTSYYIITHILHALAAHTHPHAHHTPTLPARTRGGDGKTPPPPVDILVPYWIPGPSKNATWGA